MKLHKKIKATCTLTLVTGMHIGSSKDAVEIGGIDLPVVRRKDNYEPYIPGSSLKGKLRSLLQLSDGELEFSGSPSSIRNLFGNIDKDKGHSSRLIVRDAYLTRASAQKLEDSEFNDMPFTEVKFENTIDRISGTAKHPRQIERVPAGAIFDVEFMLNIADLPESNKSAADLEKEFKATLEKGLNLLRNDYLGGHGSRGYGQVEISTLLYTPIEF